MSSFEQDKSAGERHRLNMAASSERSYRELLYKFNNGKFDVEDNLTSKMRAKRKNLNIH